MNQILNSAKIIILEDAIRKHNKLYWEDSNPEISDIEYDQLIEQIRELAPDHELVTQVNMPSVSSSGKVKFEKEMRSLGKVYEVPEFLKWASKIIRMPNEIFVLNLKLDGCSGLQKDKVLATKGDGIEGENVSNKIPILKILKDRKITSAKDFDGECRGEILILKSDFEKYKHKLTRKNGEQYKNERNASAALLATDEINTSIGEVLTLVDFTHNSIEMTYTELLTFDWEEYIRKAQYESDFPADGIVLTLKDKDYFEELGYTSHHPRGAMALKFKNPSAESTLIDIEWSVGKGTITPVGIIEPIELSGVTISRVNLHNWKNIIDFDLHIGDTVTIERAGDVIPYLVKRRHTEDNYDAGDNIDFPSFCPVCKGKTEYKNPEIICTNYYCEGKLEVKLADSVVRVGIDGLGRPTIRKMIQTINVKNVLDIFMLEKKDIFKLEGFKRASTDKLYNEIQRVKNEGLEEWQFMSSLNLPGIGRSLCKSLLKDYTINDLTYMSIDELNNLDQMSDVRSNIVKNGLCNEIDYIEELIEFVGIKEEIATSLTVCMTGSFPKKKSFYENALSSKGIEFSKSVKKDTNYLICETKKGSGKQKKAEKNNIPIVTIDQFLNIIGVDLSDPEDKKKDTLLDIF